MAGVLESVMLVCFGLSWPLNVYRNYRAATARGMSLPFILLILFGYLAGIAAKLMTVGFSFVLVIYLCNLLIVSANVAVYFRNRALDRRGT